MKLGTTDPESPEPMIWFQRSCSLSREKERFLLKDMGDGSEVYVVGEVVGVVGESGSSLEYPCLDKPPIDNDRVPDPTPTRTSSSEG